MKKYFIAGTDTDVGKTIVSQMLIRQLNQQGSLCYGIKPVASGCQMIKGRLQNSDAQIINKANPTPLNEQMINPIRFAPAIAPHIAARLAEQELSVEALEEQVTFPETDLCLVEGAGGWLTPLNDKQSYADWVELQQMEVVLVVGMKLGCLNHALLTIAEIKSRGLRLAGWVANCIDPKMELLEDNVAWLQGAINEPCLGLVPHLANQELYQKNCLQLSAIWNAK